MDVFKLLARSTNLQKSTHTSKNATHQQIPSAGFYGHRTSFTHDELNSDARKPSARKSAKRKRDEAEIRQGSDGLDRLDFFGVEDDNGVCSMKHSTTDTHSRNLQPKMDANIHKAVTKFDEAECRRIMKRHKLKATLLNVENSDHEKSTSIRPPKGSFKPLSMQPLVSFQQLPTQYGLSKRLAENLEFQGYKEPTEVQMGSLPILLGSDEDRGLSLGGETDKPRRQRSDVDILTIAPTGSGKTLAFLIHVFHGLLSDLAASKKNFESRGISRNVRALIIAPTHELADQISNEGRKLAIGTGLRIASMKKGMRLNTDRHDLDNGIVKKSGDTLKGEFSSDDAENTKSSVVKVDVLVSTPLVLLHALSSTSTLAPISLPEVRYLVLDEADILLDPLFRSQTLGIWAACVNHALRTSLWSATIGSSIESLAQSFILERRQELNVFTSKERPYHIVRLVVGLKDSAIPNISHRLVYAANEQGKLLALRQLIHPATASGGCSLTIQPPFLVFTQTIPRAIALHSELLYDIPPEAGGSSRIAVLHSNLPGATRSAIMEEFRKGRVWVLITTDLLSRGVDFRGVNGVVNYDIPNTGASYVHRVGRTGRQGREGGVAVTFYTAEDIPYVKSIANIIAASDRVHGQRHDSVGQQMHKWLLDVLPTLSKRTKKELKTKGVESRRVATERGASTRKMRISTKSGYDRKREHRRKGAVTGSRRRARGNRLGDDELGNQEWGGIDE